MICNKCGREIEGINCPQCDEANDFTDEFKKENDTIEKIVNDKYEYYYSLGVFYANEGKIHKSIDVLQKSILFNGSVAKTHSLLGLCYFEVGKLGEASKEFFISIFLDDSEENPSLKYISEIEKMVLESDKYEKSIGGYNEALEFARENELEKAIKILEKVISLSPKFVDARLLVALCYMELSENNVQKALTHIEKVLDIDKENPVAIKYIDEIYTLNTTPKVKEEKTITTQRVRNNQVGKYLVIGFVLGSVLSLGFSWIYYNNKKNELVIDEILEEKVAVLEDRIDEIYTLNVDLEQNNTLLRERNTELEMSSKGFDGNANLVLAVYYYDYDNVQKTIEFLSKITEEDVDNFSEENKKIYDNLVDKLERKEN
ncbi:MAG: tetratricopeptide repeat protein [Lachnospirales bacterium]